MPDVANILWLGPALMCGDAGVVRLRIKILAKTILKCGDAGVVKRDRLKICWLSAYTGSNPVLHTVYYF